MKNATDIFKYMEANSNIRQDFMGFLSLMRDDGLLEIPGAGKGVLETIRWELFRTKEKRDKRKR